MVDILLAAFAPIVWGSTYYITTEFLPPERPLLAGALRALPIGLVIVAFYRKLPQGLWLMRATILGILNIGLFFALLFLSAYKLPGGIAATLGAIQPLLVAGLAWLLLAERPSVLTLFTGLGGMSGVALLVLTPSSALNPIGIAAAFAGAASMAVGIVLAKRWVRSVPLTLLTAWQLVIGGVFLAILSFFIEGIPPQLSLANLAAFAYLGLIGTGLAYTLWFRGIEKIGVSVSFLGLLSPIVATLLGYLLLNQRLTLLQIIGAITVLGSVFLGQWASRAKPKQLEVECPASFSLSNK